MFIFWETKAFSSLHSLPSTLESRVRASAPSTATHTASWKRMETTNAWCPRYLSAASSVSDSRWRSANSNLAWLQNHTYVALISLGTYPAPTAVRRRKRAHTAPVPPPSLHDDVGRRRTVLNSWYSGTLQASDEGHTDAGDGEEEVHSRKQLCYSGSNTADVGGRSDQRRLAAPERCAERTDKQNMGEVAW